jgi:hypothetical protein
MNTSIEVKLIEKKAFSRPSNERNGGIYVVIFDEIKQIKTSEEILKRYNQRNNLRSSNDINLFNLSFHASANLTVKDKTFFILLDRTDMDEIQEKMDRNFLIRKN